MGPENYPPENTLCGRCISFSFSRLFYFFNMLDMKLPSIFVDVSRQCAGARASGARVTRRLYCDHVDYALGANKLRHLNYLSDNHNVFSGR